MPVVTFPFNPLRTNCHIVYNEKDAVIFDPSDDATALRNFLKGKNLELRAIALTHLHADHCLGCAALSAETGLPVHLGRKDWEMRNVLLGHGMTLGFDIAPFPMLPIDEGEQHWGSLSCIALATPGHTPGSLSYYFPELAAVLTGDLLFFRSVGRSDFPGGNYVDLENSLRTRIFTLPPAVIVYPGHGPETSVGAEAALNPFCHI